MRAMLMQQKTVASFNIGILDPSGIPVHTYVPVAKLLKVKIPPFTRPAFSDIVEKMVKQGVDVELSKQAHVLSLWRAINRAGYWSWSYKTGESAWRVRLSKTPVDGFSNPLVQECKRDYDTSYENWKKLNAELLKTEKVLLPTKEEATKFSRSARYHLRQAKVAPFSLTVFPDGKKYAVKLTWKNVAAG